MRGRLILGLAVVGLAASSFGSGEHQLLRDVQQHLELARQCAVSGRAQGALAHAAVVVPDHVIKVRVDCSNLPPSEQGSCRNALSGAFRMWDDALGQQVFQVCETGPADVVVHFQKNVNNNGIEVCGHSQWTRGVLNPDTQPTVVFTADVQVRMVKPNGEPLSFDQMRACAAHEFGHILGLDDSPISGNLMGRMDFNHPAVSIRPDEVQELLRARQEATQIRRTFAFKGR